jgi:two-component system cell cycle response regulator
VTLPRGTLMTLRAVQAVALAGLAAYAAQAAVAVCGSAADDFFETYIYTGLIAVAAMLCFGRALRVREERTAWLVMGSGLFCWAAAEVYYSAFLENLTSEPAFPSGADFLWLAFYPCCYVSLVLLVRERMREFRGSLWLDGIIGAVALAALAAAVVYPAIAGNGEMAADLPYVLGDVLLLGFVVGTFALAGWRPGFAWALLGLGLALGAVVDTFFVYTDAAGLDIETTLPAVLWPASALVIGCAAWQRPHRRSVSIEGWRVLVFPGIFAALALGLLAWHAVHPLNVVALVLALTTLTAVIIRAALTFSENVRLVDGLRTEALTDALTGLGNRRSLMADLESAVGQASLEQPCAVALFDLDGFKQYNDRFGHPVGDALQARLGTRLAAAIDGDGRAYRLGGDEFCVVAQTSRAGLRELTITACEALSEDGRGFNVRSSFGTALVPEEAHDVSRALNVADERLYQQKGENRRTTASRETSSALLQVLQETEPVLNGHLHEVAKLARRVGKQLGLRPGELDELSRAAQLHDIGKIAVPHEILSKPAPLTHAEWEFVRQHTLVGDRILSAAPALSSVAQAVRASHENYDGTGYPDGLDGPSIPLASRIVSVCDAYHAMTSDRPYRPAITHDEALAELRRCAGGQFDPEVVDAFCELIGTG